MAKHGWLDVSGRVRVGACERMLETEACSQDIDYRTQIRYDRRGNAQRSGGKAVLKQTCWYKQQQTLQ